MADDTLDDLENGFDDDVEDILETSSLDDPVSDEQDVDQDEAGGDSPEEQDEDDFDLSEDKPSKKQLLAGLLARIPDNLKTRKVLIIIGASVLAFLLLVVGLLFFLGGNGKEAPVEEQAVQSVDPNAIAEQEIVFEDIVALEPFERIRLKTSSTMGLISLNISLELTGGRYRKQIYSVEDRLRTIVETQVAEMTWLELRNPDGKIRLKYELLKRMNGLFPKATIRNIYFTFFIMQ